MRIVAVLLVLCGLCVSQNFPAFVSHVDRVKSPDIGAPTRVLCAGPQTTLCKEGHTMACHAIQYINAASNKSYTLEAVLAIDSEIVAGTQFDMCLKLKQGRNPSRFVRVDVTKGVHGEEVVSRVQLGNNKNAMSEHLLGHLAQEINQHMETQQFQTDDKTSLFPSVKVSRLNIFNRT